MSPRVVSLLASGTEIVDALGLADRLVGISHECDFPDHLLHLPRVSRPRFDPTGRSSGEIDAAVRRAMAEHGSVYRIDADLLEELQPDFVLTQAVCEVCAVPTGDVREALGARGLSAKVVSLDAHTIEDILESIGEVGAALGHRSAAERVVGSLRDRLEAVRQTVPAGDRPRTLAIEWLDPPFAPGHWVPEMIAMAGGKNLIGEPGRPSHQLSWEELSGHDPDVLVIMPCGYGLGAAVDDADAHRDRLLTAAPRAIADGRAHVVDASAFFNRSGPRFVTGVEILAGLLHPGRCPRPASSEAGVWPAPDPGS